MTALILFIYWMYLFIYLFNIYLLLYPIFIWHTFHIADVHFYIVLRLEIRLTFPFQEILYLLSIKFFKVMYIYHNKVYFFTIFCCLNALFLPIDLLLRCALNKSVFFYPIFRHWLSEPSWRMDSNTIYFIIPLTWHV